MIRTPSHAEIEAWIDTLDRAEPHHVPAQWSEAYAQLLAALQHASKVRRYSAIPAAIVAALLIIVFHGESWGADDIRNLFGAELAALLSLNFLLEKLYPVLDRESRVRALLKYYGAHDMPSEALL